MENSTKASSRSSARSFQLAQERAEQLFAEDQLKHFNSTDRIFQSLLVFQWFAAVVIACIISPRTWLGANSAIHTHVWMAVIVGAVLTVIPCLMVRYYSGSVVTRHVIAISQMAWSAFLIHLTGGRIETHFHIFGSLAFLAFYRDWKVIATATAVVALDHALRGIWWPQSVFGVITASPFRWIEHAGWVVFEDIFLLISVQNAVAASRALCLNQAELESSHRKELELLNRAMEETSCGVSILDAQQPGLPLTYVNRGFETITGYSRDEAIGKSCWSLNSGDGEQGGWRAAQNAIERGTSCKVLFEDHRKDGVFFWNELTMSPVHDDEGLLTHFLNIQNDVTEKENSKRVLLQNRQELSNANRKLARQIEKIATAEKEKEQLNKELIHASRKAGMAEVATGVLHNVGNVMNSINTSVEVLAENLKTSRLGRIDQVVELINSPDQGIAALLAQDEKGKDVQAYLKKLSEHLHLERQNAIDETVSLRANVNHVAEIVSMQQAYARLGGLAEKFCLNELCRDAIKINDAGLIRHEVELTMDLAELPPINNERNKVLQILVNFVSNAKYAVSGNRGPEKEIAIKSYMDCDQRLVIEVTDNGCGIAEEDQAKIFRHGFTTKSDGNGFGLHSSILAAREIGGDITFESPGRGMGATFRLALSMKQAEEVESVAIPYLGTVATENGTTVDS